MKRSICSRVSLAAHPLARSAFLLALPLALAACPKPSEPPPPPQPTASASVEPKAAEPPRADETLIQRSVLFGNPDRVSPQLSPDGKKLAFLAPSDGVMNVWVGPASALAEAKPVTVEKTRGLRRFFWSETSTYILYPQDTGGDENYHLFAVDLAKPGEPRDLTPYEKTRAEVGLLSPKMPGEVLVALNDRDEQHHDLYRIDVKTGVRKLVRKNEAGYAEIITDYDYVPRYALKSRADGGQDVLALGKEEKDDKPFLDIPPGDSLTTGMLGFDVSGKTLYMFESRGRDTAALATVDPKTAATKVLVEDPKSDVQGLIVHPKTLAVQAVASNYERKKWLVVDPAIAPDLDALAKVADGDFDVLSRSDDDARWVVAYVVSDGPVRYYLYDHAAKKADFLFTSSKALETAKLARMVPRVIPARDGLPLVSYLTLPPGSDDDGDGVPSAALPMVLFVHGGPWARDSFGYSPSHQWLANRGYAVLSVDYRGSTGFGKAFLNAGNKEWAGKMHDDLVDAVQWAVAQKIAKQDQVAIMGGSYGGYATLVGLTFTPETFACGVDIVGPSNLVTLLESIPPYWAPLIEQFTSRVGDHRTEEGKKLLLDRSPLGRVGAIRRPLLIGQGANDPRVKQAESDQIVKAMQDKGIPVTYVLYPDEGHGFNRPPNRTSFYAVSEIFLAQCLHGPYQPIGSDFAGSTITVPAGADAIHGLGAALGAMKP